MRIPPADDFESDALIVHAAADAPLIADLLAALARTGRRIDPCADDQAQADPRTASLRLAGARRVLGLVTDAFLAGWWCREGAALLDDVPDPARRLVPLLWLGGPVPTVPAAFRARPVLELERGPEGDFRPEHLDALRALLGSDDSEDWESIERLQRWFHGDGEALEELLGENLAWMQSYVRKHLNSRLRRRFDSMDVVQEGAMRILRYNPKHPPANRAQLRALLKKALLDALRDKIDHLQAGRRNMDREESLLAPVADDGRPHGRASEERPDVAAERQEQREWVKLALRFLEPTDRRIILLREYHRQSFEEIAADCGLSSADAARMRYNRALPKLAAKIRDLRGHDAGPAGPSPADPGSSG